MNVAHALLDGLIDYAGLFPPASLDMDFAVRAYAEYRNGPDAASLGRFIVPASRLADFAKTLAPFLENDSREPWRVSVIADGDPAAAREEALGFNANHAADPSSSSAVCDAIEIQVKTLDDVSLTLDTFRKASFRLFLEIPVQPDPGELIGKLAGTPAFAKVRTGGVVASAIPSSHDVARFIRACSENRVPFKATAGLHHALRGSYPLTYETDAPHGKMFGYLNIFLAAAFVGEGMDDDQLVQLLDETDRTALKFDDAGVQWRKFRVSAGDLHDTRQRFALSFGSCSFVEPVSEARDLNLL